MFSGIIEATGEIVDKRAYSSGLSIRIKSNLVVAEGDSVSVSGACLTATKIEKGYFWADLSEETLRLSNLKDARYVNLERALSLNSRIDGHIVTGHLDGTATITRHRNLRKFHELRVEFDKKLARFLAAKGSVALEGVSLTINQASENSITLMIIPYTFEHTTLKTKKVGSKLNIEVDILARYINRIVSLRAKEQLSFAELFS